MIIILRDNDLIGHAVKKKWNELKAEDFLIDSSVIARASVVAYMNNDLKVQIIKDRHGNLKNGMTVDRVFIDLIEGIDNEKI